MSEYRSPEAFKAALEARQKARARVQGVPFDRIAQVDLYFRFLDRVFRDLDGSIILKGGVALEMRLHRARTTGDIDLRALGSPGAILERLRLAGHRDRGDYLRFDIAEREGAEEIAGDGVVYDGRRFRVTATFAGRKYRQPFGVDVGFGDPLVGGPDQVVAPDSLSFVGIAPPMISIYPIGTHLAEKLHAYTIPRERVNGRMKDLIDIALVATEPALQPAPMTVTASALRESFETTFAFRATHPLPASLPMPPIEWVTRYPRDQALNDLPWSTIADVHAEAGRFLEPILAGEPATAWDPTARTWR